MSPPSQEVDVLIHCLFLAAIIGSAATIVIQYILKRQKAAKPMYNRELIQVSAITAFYATGHKLINTGSSTSDGVRYGMYLTSEPLGDEKTYVKEPAVIYALNLPFNTGVHLIGIGKTYNVNHLELQSFLLTANMSPVILDADLPRHVDVYTDLSKGFHGQYALDPDAINFIRKYCDGRLWELHDSELYFTVPDTRIGKGDFIIESQLFAQAIRPTLPANTPTGPIVHHELPFDVYDGPILSCPLCRKKMELHDEKWFMCTDNHGVLVTDTEIKRLESHELAIIMDNRSNVAHGPLTCPRCEHPMVAIQYRGEEIDSCTNCMFHWLNANVAGALSVPPLTAR